MVIPLVRICAGGAQQWASLLRTSPKCRDWGIRAEFYMCPRETMIVGPMLLSERGPGCQLRTLPSR